MDRIDGIETEKTALRRKYSAMRDSMSPEERRKADDAIFRNIISLPEYNAAREIFCYASYRSEPDTSAIISRALSDGKKVACPRCGELRGQMDFYYITSPGQLVPGAWGIPEPTTGDIARLTGDGDRGRLCIVPALCFDTSGGRLGYGGGYYDRFLERFDGTSAGICREASLTGSVLPAGPHDRRVDIVVTDRRILYLQPETR